jgi:hypothetical protein
MAPAPLATPRPCGTCELQGECVAFENLDRLLFRRRAYQKPLPLSQLDRVLDGFLDTFIDTLRQLELAGKLVREDRGKHLAAFFDLAVTGLYAQALIRADCTGFLQEALYSGCNTCFFPYTWMDPRLVAAGAPLIECYLPDARREGGRDYQDVKRLAKPGGRFIGDAGIKVLKAILRRLIGANSPGATMLEGGGERGEFDLVVASDSALIFFEIKAKPLVCYPLSVKISDKHKYMASSWIRLPWAQASEFSFFMGATSTSIRLSRPESTTFANWPLNDLQQEVSNPDLLFSMIQNWNLHLAGYRQWDNEPAVTRWHRFGCGNFSAREEGIRIEKRVANTKELPGLDRTDDIKKGAAQLLKFSRFKFDCQKKLIRCVLAGNMYAETHAEDYVDPLKNLMIKRGDVEDDISTYIFDGIIGLTQNHFNSRSIRDLFNFSVL